MQGEVGRAAAEIGKGICVASVVTLAAVLVFALLIKLFSIGSSVIMPVNQLIKMAAIFVGCFFCIKPGKAFFKGIASGILVVLLTYFIFAILAGEISFGWSNVLDLLFGAIAGGNCAVVKPSDYAPATSHVIQKIVANIFDPSYVVVVEGDLHVNTALLNLKFDYIFFTGSVKVGKIVMEKASHHLTPVTLELGGKSPCIVDETADIKVAARRIVWGKSINAGQTCVAPDYVYVHKSVKQSLINAMVAELRAAYGENGLQSTILPKIINDGHFDRLLGYMDGANVVFGGKSDRESRRIEVSVLDLDGEDHPVMGEEIFGPLLPVIGYTSLDDLIAAMQKKSKPLALYLFTKSRKNRDLVLGHLQFGGGCVNETVLHITSNSMPFGGVGDSGMGGYHGRASFDSFTREKGVLIKPNAVDFAFRYPRTWPAIEAKWAALQQLLRPVSPPGRRETS